MRHLRHGVAQQKPLTLNPQAHSGIHTGRFQPRMAATAAQLPADVSRHPAAMGARHMCHHVSLCVQHVSIDLMYIRSMRRMPVGQQAKQIGCLPLRNLPPFKKCLPLPSFSLPLAFLCLPLPSFKDCLPSKSFTPAAGVLNAEPSLQLCCTGLVAARGWQSRRRCGAIQELVAAAPKP